jgi:hypothetical protein
MEKKGEADDTLWRWNRLADEEGSGFVGEFQNRDT